MRGVDIDFVTWCYAGVAILESGALYFDGLDMGFSGVTFIYHFQTIVTTM